MNDKPKPKPPPLDKELQRLRERFLIGAGEFCGLVRTKCGGGYRVLRLRAPY